MGTGLPKHGKDSARTKSSKKYFSEGRRAKNKAREAANLKKWEEKIAEKRSDGGCA